MYFVIGPSYNQPKFCPSATWNPVAVTFANSTTVGTHPYGIFIDTNNSVYVAETLLFRVQVWPQGSVIPTRTVSGGLQEIYSLFVSSTGDVYVDNGASYGRVDKWTMNATNSVIAMYVNARCVGLFIDIYGNLYCSLGNLHTVVKKLFSDDINVTSITAGDGISGSTSNRLNNPQGIFVDLELNLYVADSGNDRIQLFKSGLLNATTVVGNGSNETIALNGPTGIVLDADGYLFIVDSTNHRIVGSTSNGYRCLVGCTLTNGPAPNQLDSPWSLGLDSYGNLFVADTYNNRIQQFVLMTNSCGKFYRQKIIIFLLPFDYTTFLTII
jgi:hypothetical protein